MISSGMKKYILLILALLMVSCASLPPEARNFVSTHFPNAKIVEVEREDNGQRFSVEMSDKTEIEFTRDGNWVKVEAEDANSIPTTFLPKAIAEYAAKNGLIIEGISKTNIGFRVDFVGNAPDAYFDSKGDLVNTNYNY